MKAWMQIFKIYSSICPPSPFNTGHILEDVWFPGVSKKKGWYAWDHPASFAVSGCLGRCVCVCVCVCACVHACVCAHMCVLPQSCLTLCDPMDCSPPSSSVHGISQARTLERVDISFSRGSSWPRDWTWISCLSCIGRWVLYQLRPWASPLWRVRLNLIKLEPF